MASYLYKVHITANRKAMTKFRLSIHRLMIERGRWLKVPRIDLLCVCCNKLEDECHNICESSYYSSIRKLYIKPYYVKRNKYV